MRYPCYLCYPQNELLKANKHDKLVVLDTRKREQENLKRDEKKQKTMLNQLKSKDNATIVITHYQRLLDYIVPDFVHVMYDGRIVKSGGKHLAIELEEKGYEWIKEMNL